MRSRRASKKLSDKYIGPFKNLKAVGPNAYTLKLPIKYDRLHNTFHVSLLEPWRMRQDRAPPESTGIDGEKEWELETIFAYKNTKAGRKFLVRWKGFSEADDSWEPAEHLLNAGETLNDFLKKRGVQNERDGIPPAGP